MLKNRLLEPLNKNNKKARQTKTASLFLLFIPVLFEWAAIQKCPRYPRLP